ncbi:MAG TPA: glutamate--tRNA ligase [Candidatus Paceibacterota bacterium]|nr:glutamate--tRNA ligase [Candidatus Paceibacterota bacterium]
MMTPRKEIKNPRVRIAPSPTGYFHIGTARTALFNWLFAKKYNGKFIVRIEDTDRERSKIEFEKDIIEQMKWLGLDWDEGVEVGGDFGPYRQTECLDLYEKYLHQLIDEKKAYYCFCSPEELEAKKQEMAARGESPRYDGSCRNLSPEVVEEKLKNNTPYVIRIKTPDKKVAFNDMIRGKVEFDCSLFGDLVIAKSLREPLYNFAVVIDDHRMQLTHVIRGEDHLSNTPKQIILYEAFGWDVPEFGHLPLILAPDKSKMSKRFGDVSVAEYRKNGYLPEALFNFIVFLGWHPEEKPGEGIKEILTKEEILDLFDVKRIQKGGAIFNVDKLNWINAEHIKKMPIDELTKRSSPYLENVFGEKILSNQEYLKKVIESHRDRIKKLSDLPEMVGFFFNLSDYPKELLIWKDSILENTKGTLELLISMLTNLKEDEYNKNQLEAIIMPEAEKRGRGEILWPLRVALSGLKNSAGPFEIIPILGKEETLRRLEIAKNKIQ